MVRISVAALLALATSSLAAVAADAPETQSLSTPNPSDSASPLEPQVSGELMDEIDKIVDEAFRTTREFQAKKPELKAHGVLNPDAAVAEIIAQMGNNTNSTVGETRPGEVQENGKSSPGLGGPDDEKHLRNFASSTLSLRHALDTIKAQLTAEGVDPEKVLYNAWSKRIEANTDDNRTESSTTTSSTAPAAISPDVPPSDVPAA